MKPPNYGPGTASCFRRSLSKLLNLLRLADKPDHRAHVRLARTTLSIARRFRGETAADRAFSLLRCLDAPTFEEVVLSALEDSGHIVFRCRHYSDAGKTAAFVLDQDSAFARVALQIEPYGSSLSAARVGDFLRAIEARGFSGGLLVHCGRTGPMAKLASAGTSVTVVSGSAFLNLVLRSLPPTRCRQPPWLPDTPSWKHPDAGGRRRASRQPA